MHADGLKESSLNIDQPERLSQNATTVSRFWNSTVLEPKPKLLVAFNTVLALQSKPLDVACGMFEGAPMLDSETKVLIVM